MSSLSLAPDKAWLLLQRVLLVVALMLLGGYLIVFLAYAVNLIQFPFDYDQGEGFELVDTLLFSQGRWPYQDIEVYPFYASNYPPLFHLLAVPFAWVFGAGLRLMAGCWARWAHSSLPRPSHTPFGATAAAA